VWEVRSDVPGGGLKRAGVLRHRGVAWVAIAVLVLVAGAAVSAVVMRQGGAHLSTAGPAPAPTAHPTPSQRVLTAAERAYADAMWPIHRDVENGATRMSTAAIFFKAGDIDGAGLHTRVGAVLNALAADRQKMQALQAPKSLQPEHGSYTAALEQYVQAAAVLEQVTSPDDGRLVGAASSMEAASRTLRDVGLTLWPGEFTPN
jgi:cell division protein FtsN